MVNLKMSNKILLTSIEECILIIFKEENLNGSCYLIIRKTVKINKNYKTLKFNKIYVHN